MAETTDSPERQFTSEAIVPLVSAYGIYGINVRNIVEDTLDERITDSVKQQAFDEINDLTVVISDVTQNELEVIIPDAYNFGLDSADSSAIEALENPQTTNIPTKASERADVAASKKALDEPALTTKPIPKAGFTAVPNTTLTVEAIESAAVSTLHGVQVNILLDDALEDFARGLRGVNNAAQSIINRAQIMQLRDTIAKGKLEGAGISAIKADVLKELQDQGFVTFITRDGRKMPLDWYAETLARTEINKAMNEAVITRAAELGVRVVEFSTHLGSCEICIPHEGVLYDLEGKAYDFPPEPPLHPNCGHVLLLRPDIDLIRDL